MFRFSFTFRLRLRFRLRFRFRFRLRFSQSVMFKCGVLKGRVSICCVELLLE